MLWRHAEEKMDLFCATCSRMRSQVKDIRPLIYKATYFPQYFSGRLSSFTFAEALDARLDLQQSEKWQQQQANRVQLSRRWARQDSKVQCDFKSTVVHCLDLDGNPAKI